MSRFETTEHFKDWDGVFVPAGTLAEKLETKGRNRKGRQFYNLINGDTVVAVTLGKPPCRELP